MMYRGLRTAARAASRISLTQPQTSLRRLPIQFQQVRNYADLLVKVPQMAESISEGTLKQFNKQVGDYVEQDEEIATIETDKVRNIVADVDPSQLRAAARLFDNRGWSTH